MNKIKTDQEIEIMAEGGDKLSYVLSQLVSMAKSGVTTLDLDREAEKLILQAGGKPSFKMVPGYKYTICTTVNDEVVHGLPSGYEIKEGDIVGIDIGIFYKGFHTDTSQTVKVGDVKRDTHIFLEAGKTSLIMAIKEAVAGNRVWDISAAMEKPIKASGFAPVKSLTGHGIGRELHEEPHIPCFTLGRREDSIELKEGMVLAIETIYNQRGADVVYKNDDDWTISTKDGALSAVFEATVAIFKGKPRVLTPLPFLN